MIWKKIAPNEKDTILAELRRQRDWYAAHGMHDDALILNDRIKDLKEGRTSVMVERVMKRFESVLARYDAEKTRVH
jgi:hypothetical protein